MCLWRRVLGWEKATGVKEWRSVEDEEPKERALGGEEGVDTVVMVVVMVVVW